MGFLSLIHQLHLSSMLLPMHVELHGFSAKELGA